MRLARAIAGVAGVLALVLPTVVLAADGPSSAGPKAAAKSAASVPTVALFEGMKDGRLDVTIVPSNSKVAHLRVRNLTKAPLNVELPKAFAAAPILAQFNMGFGNNQMGNMTVGNLMKQNNTPQIIATGQSGNQPGQQPPGMNPGMGLQNIPAGRIGDVRLTCVCLQYGNPDPSTDIPYEVVRLDDVSKSPALRAVIEEMAAGTLDRPVAQLAAWHYANGLTLKELANTGYAYSRIKETAGLIDRLDKGMMPKEAPAVADDNKPIISSQSKPLAR